MSDVLTPNHLIYDHNIRRKGNIVISEDIMKDQSKRFSQVYLNELRQYYINRKNKLPKYYVLIV